MFKLAVILDLRRIQGFLPEGWQDPVLGLEPWKVCAAVLILLLAALLRWAVMALVAGQARRGMERLKAPWAKDVLARADAPLGLMAWVGVVAFLLPELDLPLRLSLVLALALRSTAAAAGVWLGYRMVDLASGWLEHRATETSTLLDDQLAPLVRTSLKVVVLAIGTVFVLQNLEVDVGSLLAGLGLGGLAFALAARDTVANFFGATTIFLDRPFHVGEVVSLAGVDGVVESVGFRSTRIRTFYNSLVTVPNAKVAESVIDNLGARTARRMQMTLGLTYDASREQVLDFVSRVRAVLAQDPRVRDDFQVQFTDFGASSLDIVFNAHLLVQDWGEELETRAALLLGIWAIADELGVSFAFPTQTLHVPQLEGKEQE